MKHEMKHEMFETFQKDLSKKVKRFMDESGVSAHQLSGRAGVDPHVIYDILNCNANPTAATLIRVGSAIGRSLELR